MKPKRLQEGSPVKFPGAGVRPRVCSHRCPVSARLECPGCFRIAEKNSVAGHQLIVHTGLVVIFIVILTLLVAIRYCLKLIVCLFLFVHSSILLFIHSFILLYILCSYWFSWSESGLLPILTL